MAFPLFLALVLLAGSTQHAYNSEKSIIGIDIADIVDAIRDIIAGIDLAALVDTLRDLVQNIPDLINLIRDILPGLVEEIREIIVNLPQIVESVREILANLRDRLPEIVANLPGRLPEIIADLLDRYPGLLDRVREIISSIPNYVNLPELVARLEDILDRVVEFVRAVDWPAISDALSGISINWDAVIDAVPDIIANLPEAIGNLPDIIDRLPEIIGNIGVDLPAIFDALPNIDRDPGLPTHLSEYPSLVQLEFGLSSIWLQYCTASIMNSGYVLTAARCVSGPFFNPSRRRIRAGATTRGRDGSIYPISYAIAHDDFSNSNGFEGDIAVVRVGGIINYGPLVQRVGITGSGVFFPAGVRVITAGWGSTAQGRNIANRELHHTDLLVVDNWACQAKYAAQPIKLTVTTKMICAGRARSGGRMSDFRDAGGPLYYSNVLVGVLSFGRPLGNDTVPVVATCVSTYSDWIVRTAV